MRAKELLKEYHQKSKDEKCPHCGGPMFSETLMMEKKDACYYKVKSRYKVWPSAYASGALVKCRKKGASNWGNKNESSDDNFGKPAAMMKSSPEALKTAQSIVQKQADSNVIGQARIAGSIPSQGVAEGSNDTIYPNAEVIKSKNGKPVGEIYQDGNSWGAFHYRADRGYDLIDSREDAIEALKDLHQETGRSRPDYTIKGVTEAINPDITNPEFGHQQQIGDYLYVARYWSKGLKITAYHGNKQIGYAELMYQSAPFDDFADPKTTPKRIWLESEWTRVDPKYQRQGIMSTMYAYAKMLGNSVKPSQTRSDDAKAAWKSWRQSGDAQHLTREGVAEGSNELYQKAIRKYAQQVANDYLGGGNDYLYGANKFDSEMFGVDPKQAQQDFKTLFAQLTKQQGVAEEWSQKYKKSINCSHPKGFSQKAHCAGKKKHNESIEMEMTCPNCGMCETHGDHSRNTLDEACWKGYHKEGNKKMFGKTYPNCVKNTNEEQELDENLHKWFKEKWVRFGPDGKIRGDCARGDDSEGKPKCLPQSKAHSLGKKGRASAAARKRREDPNPERSGKAINVNTKKKSNEDITEISDVTKQSYKQQAQQQVKDLKPHAEKGEYKDIAQRAIDRRERGLKRLGK